MYKSAHRFFQKLPATRFWRDYAPVHYLKLVNSDEVLLDALSDAIGRNSSKITTDQFSDFELAGLLVVVANRGLATGLALKIADEIDRRLDIEAEDISLSESQRVLIEAAVKSAASNWRSSR